MHIRQLITSATTLAMATTLTAGNFIVPGDVVDCNTSFAIVTDSATWADCSAEIEAFAQQLGSEGLPTFIAADNWKNPEQVKILLKSLYNGNNLEGAIFLGNVPIPMIRKAQHLTSAFKMNEKIDRRESSVPSDRFYDDFNLKFDFVGADSLNNGFFYYELAADSPNDIKCDIYTGRVKPIANGEAPATQIRRFLNKATKLHKENNKLDQFYSHTGEGSFSNSLNAWTQEAFTLREQMPGTFDSPTASGRTRFTRYNFSDYPKDDIIEMLIRDDLDLTMFHEHGMPFRQYISSTPAVNDTRMKNIIAYQLREYARRYNGDSAKTADFIKTYGDFGFAPSWWENYNETSSIEADSITDAATGIMLEDITDFKPNSRIVVLDACYNGDFREDDCIASRYIFADGNTVATFANSVNVLQDKQANELLGLLWLGARIGQWAKETNILESHILGDPTFRFTPAVEEIDGWELCLTPYDEDATVKMLQSPYADVRNLAMHRLWRNNAPGVSDTLKNIFLTSPRATERYTALSLLEKINDNNYNEILPVALVDPSEFIRRTTVTRMGKVGLDDYVPYLVDAYFDDTQAERVMFQIENNIPAFSTEAVDKALSQHSGDRVKKLKRAHGKQQSIYSGILDEQSSEKRYKKLYMQSLRNNNIHAGLDKLIALLDDPNETEDVKMTLLDALAWYDESYRRPEIIEACARVIATDGISDDLRRQAIRTYHRVR